MLLGGPLGFQPLGFAGSGSGVTLTVSLVQNTNTFYSATVSSTYSLTPSLYTLTNTFYAATVAAQGPLQTLTPSLFTASNAFYAPTVSATYALTLPALTVAA